MKKTAKQYTAISNLRLHKETIRALTERELSLPVGGAAQVLSESCIGGCKPQATA